MAECGSAAGGRVSAGNGVGEEGVFRERDWSVRRERRNRRGATDGVCESAVRVQETTASSVRLCRAVSAPAKLCC